MHLSINKYSKTVAKGGHSPGWRGCDAALNRRVTATTKVVTEEDGDLSWLTLSVY